MLCRTAAASFLFQGICWSIFSVEKDKPPFDSPPSPYQPVAWRCCLREAAKVPLMHIEALVAFPSTQCACSENKSQSPRPKSEVDA
ncbi:hypothetical protein BKA64DRAFT_15382 [Cadophora sp. MPI-SDFR-AT-0126]|nr:hypothetical protein BKA64DRAFT_15382 [Leotiomycetes sp. MPI-SDFR-AT-0126]